MKEYSLPHDPSIKKSHVGKIIRYDLGQREHAGLHHCHMLGGELGWRVRVSVEYYRSIGLAGRV